MIWVSIILGIIEAIPSIIKVIQEIAAAIHGNPVKTHAFMGLLLRHQADPAGAEADLRAFHAVHVLGQPAA